ncbi:MAG: Gfo/Idh/MocA family protein [Bacillota bacterium]
MTFKICVIGCGFHAFRVHGPSYRKYANNYDNVELTACCDVKATKAQEFKEEFNFNRYYTDIDKMLKQEEPDAVCLLVSENLIAPLSIKILEKGYPLFLEKPPGLNKDETIDMLKIANKNSVPHQVGFNRRFIPLIEKFIDIFTKNFKNRSRIQNIKYDLFRVDRMDADFAATAIHGIDTVKFLADTKYQKVNFEYQKFPELGDKAENIYLNCQFDSGITAQINFCPVSGVVIERIVINCYNSTFFINLPIWNKFDFPGELIWVKKNEVKFKIRGDELIDSGKLYITNGFYRENVNFFEKLRHSEYPQANIESALQSVEISDCIRKRKRVFEDNNFNHKHEGIRYYD